MRNLLYILITLALVSSCRTLEKMIERGEYDNAIIYATEKLAGKKKKKTKHVTALEEAFVRITKRDMDQINYLEGNKNPENWDRIFDIASKIEYRQNRIEPFLPLISKDGYEANFNFVRTNEIKKQARDGAAAYYYNEGVILLAKAETEGSKKYARSAFDLFKQANNRRENYEDSYDLMGKAHNLGKVNIKIDVVNNSNTIVPKDFEKVLLGLGIGNMNTRWRTYHTTDKVSEIFDYHAILEIDNIDVSPEKEIIRDHIDEKKIKDGYKFLKNKKGKFVLDTAGKKIKVEKFRHVTAFVTEIERQKAAYVSGNLIYMSGTERNIISRKPLSVEALFSDYASSFRGDKRALCTHDHKRIKDYPRRFPNDFEMILDASENMKAIFKSELSRFRI